MTGQSMFSDHPASRGVLREKEPMAKHTTWRVGGNATLYYEPRNRQDLSSFFSRRKDRLPVFWLGLGSNLLVRDGGLDALVIATKTNLSKIEWIDQNLLYAESGVPCPRLAKEVAEKDYAELDFLAGIPGTLGGALCMNAGALGTEIWSLVKSVDAIDPSGKISHYDASCFKPHYRGLSGPADWFLGAYFSLSKPGFGKGVARIKEVLAKRKDSQPIGAYSCGSVFKNPRGHFAGQLIEECDLKGFAIGGARVSSKHANFIINGGTATAAEIEHLIYRVKSEVLRRKGISLELEVEIHGNKAPAAEECL